MKNWKTTLFGALAAVAGSMAVYFPEHKELLTAVAGVFAALFAFFAKDNSISGTGM